MEISITIGMISTEFATRWEPQVLYPAAPGFLLRESLFAARGFNVPPVGSREADGGGKKMH